MATAPKPVVTIHGRVAARIQPHANDERTDPGLWSVTFQPDDANGQGNSSWAQGTPAIAMELNVKAAVAAKLEPGAAVTITIAPA